jgi:hypothetical protein
VRLDHLLSKEHIHLFITACRRCVGGASVGPWVLPGWSVGVCVWWRLVLFGLWNIDISPSCQRPSCRPRTA